LVEDNPIALKVLENMVSKAGYHPTTATDGEKALALAKSGEFDLIITDIGLSDISGRELAHFIREWEKENAIKNTPIIGLTGHARETAMAECLESGMNDVFTKPASLAMIREIVNKFISQQPSTDTPSNSKATLASFGKLDVDLPDTEDALFELESFPVFDPKYGLQQINDLALLMDIWKAYLSDEMQNDVNLMKKAHAKKDWEEVDRLAHKIKGGVCYGTRRLFYACQYLERYYKVGHRTLLDKLYHQVLNVNEETIATLNKWLGKYGNK
jgi:CheY-like chemotaxis protein/HPt (histidine-containing phosphotransfer) domain-containing protein